MVITERSSLTRPTDPPTYVEFAGILMNRRTKVRQFQCCICASLFAIFVMVLLTVVSYSMSKTDPLVDDSTNPEIVPPSPPMELAWMQGEPNLKNEKETNQPFLTTSEWEAAVQAGQEAITMRITADYLGTPLPAPSPDSRHQYAVKTSVKAGKLALGGIGELAATRFVEKSRVKLGAPSSIGSYFKNIWVPTDTCKEYSTTVCTFRKYRTFDGTCNHPRNYGAALTPFIRKLPADYADEIDLPRTGKFNKPLPSAREISLKVHPPAPSSNPDFTVMLAVFGQFLDHDITATAVSQGTNGSSLSCCPKEFHQHPECFAVEVGPGDPVFDKAGKNCMEFVRSAPAPQCKIGPRQQLNQVTSFIDGSVIYGPDDDTANSLREGQGGLLRMFVTPDNRTLLPLSMNPNDGCNRNAENARGRYCFASGDGRANENLHLTTMHLLWSRQHNKVAKELAMMNPMWNDETIFQEARRIIGAQLQHITYKEFIPVILGEEESNLRKLKPLSSGFRPQHDASLVNPGIANSFASAAFRFAHTLLPGLMKVTNAQNGTSSYVELHRMLFNPYSLYAKGGMDTSLTTATSNVIQKTSTHVTSQLTKHLFQDPLANSSIPCGLDLVSLNIQRGRDHGLPGYTAWREFCGLGKVQTFEELRGKLDDDALNEISKLYDHVDDIDLYTGALAEIKNSDGLIGPTFKCLIGDQFSRLQQGDRFWYETPGNLQSFTEDQLNEIRKTTLAKLICDCSDGIYHIQPAVMRSVNTENPMVSCEDLPSMDLSLWMDRPSSILQASSIITERPEKWVKFKNDIESTVKEVVDDFVKNPVSGNTSWVEFKKWLNSSFAELRNEIETVEPLTVGAIRRVSSAMGKSKSIPIEDSDKPEPNIDSPTYDDWIRLKNAITANITTALVNATGIPTTQQRSEMLESISSEVKQIETMITFMKTSQKGSQNNTLVKNGNETASDFMKLSNDLIQAINAAINRTENEAPPPGDLAWATYGAEIRKQFDDVSNYARMLFNKTAQIPPAMRLSNGNTFASLNMSKNVIQRDPKAETLLSQFNNNPDESTSDAIARINEKKSIPKGPKSTTTSRKIMKTSSKFEKDFSEKDNEILEQAPVSMKDPLISNFWDNFRQGSNESQKNAFSDIAARNPPPVDPAWTSFHSDIMNTVSTFKNEFTKFKGQNKSAILNKAQPENGTIVPFDWYTFKSGIIHSVTDILNMTIKNIPLANKTMWEEFKTKIISQYKEIPSKETSNKLLFSVGIGKDSISSKGAIFDWLSLKNEINKAVNEIINNKLNKQFSVADISSASTKSRITLGAHKLNVLQSSAVMEDWLNFKKTINDSLAHSFGSMESEVSFLTKNTSWSSFKAAIKDQFSALRTVIDSLSANTSSEAAAVPSVPVVQISDNMESRMEKLNEDAGNLSIFRSNRTFVESMENGSKKGIDPSAFIPAIDWIAFKKEINSTLVNYLKVINETDAEEWKVTKNLIQNSFMELRDQILASKNHTIDPSQNL